MRTTNHHISQTLGSWKSIPDLVLYSKIDRYSLSGILIYRLFRNGPKPILKIAHAVIMISIFVLTVIALIAVFDFHNLKSIPNMYSFHSWIGILTVILFSLQVYN